MTPHRPIARYFGGKWHAAPWIVGAMPEHRVYTESFAGAASVLLRKPRAEVEILSDLDFEVVWLHRLLGGDLCDLLANFVRVTPYERASIEMLEDLDPTDFVRRALRVLVRGAMTRSAAITRSNGRVAGYRDPEVYRGTRRDIAEEWRRWPDAVPAFHERLSGVEVLHQPAIKTLRAYDAEDCLHYVDPPYVPSARSAPGKGYKHDMTADDHAELLAVLRDLRGAVLLSGYDCELYKSGLPGWRRLERASTDAGGKRRVEVLWLNPACAERSPALRQGTLFDIIERAA